MLIYSFCAVIIMVHNNLVHSPSHQFQSKLSIVSLLSGQLPVLCWSPGNHSPTLKLGVSPFTSSHTHQMTVVLPELSTLLLQV